MAKWVPGQSGNPNGRPRRGRSVAELARAIAQEKVEFADADAVAGVTERATYTRLERLLRVMWTMALDGELPAIRCLLEYMEGKPVQVVAENAGREEPVLTADELERRLRNALAEVEAWRRQVGDAAGENGESSRTNG